MSDAASLATLDVLTKLRPPALDTDNTKHCPGHLSGSQSQPDGGNCDGSCFAYVVLGLLARTALRRLPGGFRFGQLDMKWSNSAG